MTEENQVQPTSLTDILSGQEPVQQPEPVQTEPQPEPEPEAEPQTDAKADEPAQPGEPSSSEENEPTSQTVPLKALESERHKRQELERRLAALESQNDQLHSDEPEIDPLLEPEKFVEESEKRVTSKVDNDMFNMRVEMSQMMLRSQFEDYDEVEAVFLEAAEKNPALAIQLRQSPMPAQFAYQEGQRLKFLNSIGDDPKSYEQKIREEERAKVLEELKTQSSDQEKTDAVEAAPKSLADAPNTAPRKGPEWEGPTPLTSILK